MKKPLPIKKRIAALEKIIASLERAVNLPGKIEVLNQFSEVQEFPISPEMKLFLETSNLETEFAIKSVLAIGQGFQVFHNPSLNHMKVQKKEWDELINILLDLQQFYGTLGGIIGYHLIVLKLIVSKGEKHSISSEGIKYLKPVGIDLSKDSAEVRKAIRWGLESLEIMAEMYPVGGAGDRLKLQHEGNGEFLPAAALSFGGRTLLEGLIRDLQGREFLYYKIFDKQLCTPIAMMTSHEKNNFDNITQICQREEWFGRPRTSYNLFIQPQVPMITAEGNWVMQGPMQLMVKPGGHGVIWKLAMENGVFDWFHQQNRFKALVRQINNPIAGTDHGLLSFSGIGNKYNKAFGFAACARQANATEGVDVLIETEVSTGYDYCISNVEYTDFEQKGISNGAQSDDFFVQLPANTNILFVDLNSIKAAVEKCPIPGMLINMKNPITEYDVNGNSRLIEAGRLESTMQNIADCIVDHYPQKLETIEMHHIRSYVAFNERQKTIAVAKKSYNCSEPSIESIMETPEGCFYTVLKNHYDLFTHYCGMQLPSLETAMAYMQKGPSFLLQFHPALGPLYQIIAQKIRGGSLEYGSELKLEIAELDIFNLSLHGSLLIHADAVMGRKNSDGVISYSQECGKCTLHNIQIKNKGINRLETKNYWKNEIKREEALSIVLRGNAEFYAENVTIIGSHTIEVPDGYRMIASMTSEGVKFQKEKIQSPSWHWKYAFDKEDRIILSK